MSVRLFMIGLCLFVLYCISCQRSYFYVDRGSSSYITYCSYSTCDVYFTDSINEEDKYLSLYHLISVEGKHKTINLHLSGNGGSMATVYHLANSILQSKAEINTIVEGPVYSAHAFIAMLGHKIIVYPNSDFLFHLPAILSPEQQYVLPNDYCIYMEGMKDRGQDAVSKCLLLNKGEQDIFDSLFKAKIAPFLTKNEITQIYQGYDVVVLAKEMQKRINNIPH